MHDAAMTISVILGHPHAGSFNHAIASQVVTALKSAGHLVAFHDLYLEGFDPLITGYELATDDVGSNALVERHCQELRQAEGIVIIHPNWWGMPPAILKGWVDRVFRPGVAYEFADGDDGSGIPTGLLQARAALVLTTSNTSDGRERQVFGDPLETIWRNCIFGFCGITKVIRRNFSVIIGSTNEQRAGWIAETATIVRQVFDPARAVANDQGVA